MTPLQREKILAKAIRQIADIAAEPGEAGAVAALKEAQDIAHQALIDVGLVPSKVLKFARIKDITE